MAEKVSNEVVAKQFYLLALVMDVLEEKWRANTYRKAARRIEDLSSDLEEHWLNGDLTKLEGIGESISAKIGEYYETGKIGVLEENKHLLPEDLELLNDIPALSERRLATLIREGGMKSIEDLLQYLKYGSLSEFSGFTSEIEEQIQAFLRWRREQSGEVPLPIVLRSTAKIFECLKGDLGMKLIECAGPVRRRASTVNNVTLLLQSNDPETSIARFGMCEEVDELTVVEKESALGKLRSGAVCMLKTTKPEAMVIDELTATGSEKHLQQLRKVAKQNGYQLTSNGLFRGKEKIELSSEEDVYRILGLPYFPPEMREGRIDVTKPIEDFPLIEPGKGYRGDFHVHSDFSNGVSTISELAYAAKYLGLEYLCLLDRLGQTRGSMDWIAAEDRNEKIDSIAKVLEIQIIKGVEVDIRADGSLDAPGDLRERFELIAGGVHTSLGMEKKKMTERLISCIESGSIDLLCHPTCRIIGYREQLNLDLMAIAEAAAEKGVALEINATPDRLDLSDEELFQVKDSGAFFYVGTDAHSVAELDNWKWGANITRRALLDPSRLLNRLNPDQIRRRGWRGEVS